MLDSNCKKAGFIKSPRQNLWGMLCYYVTFSEPSNVYCFHQWLDLRFFTILAASADCPFFFAAKIGTLKPPFFHMAMSPSMGVLKIWVPLFFPFFLNSKKWAFWAWGTPTFWDIPIFFLGKKPGFERFSRANPLRVGEDRCFRSARNCRALNRWVYPLVMTFTGLAMVKPWP